MLTRLQQQMEEEAANKQRMLVNHLQMMSRMNLEMPGVQTDGGIETVLQKLQV